jgi:hypothetical protein
VCRLAESLRTDGIGQLIIAGGMTEYCVDTTCRRAVTLGYDVTLVADAHLTRDTILTAAQIIAHHNLLLEGLSAGIHSIKVTPASEIFLGSLDLWVDLRCHRGETEEYSVVFDANSCLASADFGDRVKLAV